MFLFTPRPHADLRVLTKQLHLPFAHMALPSNGPSRQHGTSLSYVALTSTAASSDSAPLQTLLASITEETHAPSVVDLSRRAESSTSCSGKNADSALCETPVRTNYLAIGLGIAIPVVLGGIVLLYLHYRNMKRLRKEEEADKDLDIDNDFFPHQEMAHHPPRQPSMGEKSMASSTIPPKDPFNTPYRIPQLSSSQTSLNNYDPYDVHAYPPTPTLQSPKYPRSGSPVSSIASNPYSDSHRIPYTQNPSQQALNPSSTSLNKPFVSQIDTSAPFHPDPTRVDSPLSVVSSKTPVETAHIPPVLRVASLDMDEEPYYPHLEQNVAHTVPDQQVVKPSVEVHETPEVEAKPSVNFLNVPNEENSGQATDLQRSQTKGGRDFERVKSIYNEYFPREEDNVPFDLQAESSNAQNVQTGVAVPQGEELPTSHDDANEAQNQYAYSQQQAHDEVYQSQGHQDDQYYQNYNGHPAQAHYAGFNEGDYHGNYPESHYSQREYDDQGNHFHGQGNVVTHEVIIPPSQQSQRPARPLTVLSELPTPHKLEEHGSSIGYAPHRRNNGSASPSVGMFHLNAPVAFEDKPLASPSQMRDSITMSTLGGFAPPKKFSNNNRSNSLTERDETGSLRSGFSQAGGPAPRPPSELVPTGKFNLKPSMNLGYTD